MAPSYWGELNTKEMSVKALKKELEERGAVPKGDKSKLAIMLQKLLDSEKAEEERLAAIRKAEKAEKVVGLAAKYATVKKAGRADSSGKFRELNVNQVGHVE